MGRIEAGCGECPREKEQHERGLVQGTERSWITRSWWRGRGITEGDGATGARPHGLVGHRGPVGRAPELTFIQNSGQHERA